MVAEYLKHRWSKRGGLPRLARLNAIAVVVLGIATLASAALLPAIVGASFLIVTGIALLCGGAVNLLPPRFEPFVRSFNGWFFVVSPLWYLLFVLVAIV